MEQMEVPAAHSLVLGGGADGALRPATELRGATSRGAAAGGAARAPAPVAPPETGLHGWVRPPLHSRLERSTNDFGVA